MSEHIDVVSYLLGAIVFSVGFLSARLHASADAQRQEANTASWRIREILTRGDHVAPSELVGLLSIVRGRGDRIADLIRWLNGWLLLSALLVTLDFYRLVRADEVHSTNATFLITVLAIASMAVGVLGEADARHLRHSVGAEFDQTTLGHVEKIDSSLREGRLDAVDPEVEALNRLFPTWGLTFEIRALVALRKGQPDRALEMVLEYLEGSSDDVYLSSVVGCASAIRLKSTELGLKVLKLVESKGPLSRDDLLMRSALQLRAGHLDVVIGETWRIGSRPAGSDDVEKVNLSRLAFTNLGVDDLGTLTSKSALDVRPAQMPALHGVIGDYQRWGTSPASWEPDDLSDTTFGLLLEMMELGSLPDDLVERHERHAATVEDGAAVESIGLFLLIGGRPRSAVVVLERAVAKNPKSARVHWAHAVSCWYWGWEDKAAESLERALALDPESIVVAETRRRFQGHQPDPRSDRFLEVLSRVSWTAIEVLQLALIGIDVRTPNAEDPSPQQAFVAATLDLAHKTSNRAHPVDA